MPPKLITYPFGDRTYKSTLYYGQPNIESLRDLPDECIQCVVTGPPYWGLRSYLQDNDPLKDQELGQEDTPQAYIQKVVEVFCEVRRVLRRDGTIWINIADCYATSPKGKPGALSKGLTNNGQYAAIANTHRAKRSTIVAGLKPKDLVLIPDRLCIALQEDGWYIRSKIIWSKGTCMPESVEDRPTTSHEYVFLISKSRSYLYDADAIREPGHNKWTVWHINPRPYKGAHFATFPTTLVEPCIKAGSRPGDTVLDPFSGSGTTGYVANRLGRDYVGMDLNPNYLPLAEKRILGMDPEVEPGEEIGTVSVLDLLG